VHDPYSYEIETWTQLQAQFPKRKRVIWARVDPGRNVTMEPSASPVKKQGGAA
jgi:hypothetical protein